MAALRDPAVQALLDRQEIRDALRRYCRAVDRRDLELLRSIYHPAAMHAYGSYRMNAHDFAAIIVESIAQYRVTSHFLSNECIELKGDSAHVESYVQAVHRHERDGQELELVLALRYVDRFERHDGAWKIASRLTLHDWSRETPVDGDASEAADVLPGRRDREDASYE